VPEPLFDLRNVGVVIHGVGGGGSAERVGADLARCLKLLRLVRTSRHRPEQPAEEQAKVRSAATGRCLFE
jgi:hypothetical protein